MNMFMMSTMIVIFVQKIIFYPIVQQIEKDIENIKVVEKNAKYVLV